MQGVFGTPYRHQPRALSWHSLLPLARALGDVVVIVGGVLFYFLVRGLVDGREAEATDNAHALIDFERRLGIFWEPQLQEFALNFDAVRTAANWVYIWGHWPVITSILIWLLVKHRDSYRFFRNTLLLSGAMGLVVFSFFPMAPPRFIETMGFVDTITLHSESYRVLQPPSLVNQYAAMPSLHVGWDLLMGIALFQHLRGRWRWFAVLLPVMMFASVVLTANHYLLDGIVGAGLVLLSYGIVRHVRLPRLQRQAKPRPATA
jgi:hypothetical protein